MYSWRCQKPGNETVEMYASGKRYCYETLMHHSTPLHSPNNALHSPTYGFDVEWMSITGVLSRDQLPQDQLPRNQLPPDQLPPDQLARGLLPPDQLPTRSTPTRSIPTRSTSHQINSHEVYSHQINFPPDQLP